MGNTIIFLIWDVILPKTCGLVETSVANFAVPRAPKFSVIVPTVVSIAVVYWS